MLLSKQGANVIRHKEVIARQCDRHGCVVFAHGRNVVAISNLAFFNCATPGFGSWVRRLDRLGSHLQSFCRIFEHSHLTVLELYRFDDYQSVYPERRRTLGGTGRICGSGDCSASHVSGRHCDGSRHGRASHQHDPTVLGIARLSDGRDKPTASDGIYGHKFLCRGDRVRGGAAGVGVAESGSSRRGLREEPRRALDRSLRRSTSYMPIGPTSIATRQTSSLKCLPAENRCTSSMTS
jgi:hypothetical protein